MDFPPDVLKFMISMSSLVPLCYPLRYMNQQIKFWYSLILGFVFQIWVYEMSIYPVIAHHFIVYAIIKNKGPKVGRLITFESLIFLFGYHLYEILFNYGGFSMNAVVLLMILVCKYSLFAYNIEDGALD